MVRDLTQGSIVRQMLSLALPLMAVSFISMTYSLVDIVWIGRLGSRSVAAVGSIGMLLWMMNSVALISKIGAEISIGQSIGAKRPDKASLYASHTTTLALMMGITFGLLFFLFPKPYVSFFKLEPDIVREACDYLKIISLGLPLMFLTLNFSGIYVGSGRSDIPFYFNASGLIMNILLDPILIFGIGFFPRLGTQGAALATVLSEGLVLLLFVIHLKKRQSLFGSFPFLIRLRRRYTFNILKLGLPVAFMNVFFAFINMNLARTASIFGGYLGITSQSTGGQIEGISWNTSTGFATALGSFVAQNYAAGRMDRAVKAFRYSAMLMTVFGLCITVLFMLFGKEIFSLFIPEPAAYEAGGEYLFIVGFSQLFMMIELSSQGMFNGIGKTTPPAIVSILFNTLRIPLALFLANRIGITGVWWAIAVSSILKGIVLPLWLRFFRRRMVANDRWIKNKKLTLN